VTRNKTYKELESEKVRGKKRYIERIAEEHEADELIREYQEEQEEQDIDDREEPFQKLIW
jgi:hypothetical protein